MQSERDWLNSRLAEYVTELRQLRWNVVRGYVFRETQEFAHASRRHSKGINECMVTAHFDTDGRLVLRRYALPSGTPEWIECDEDSFYGFAAEGSPGLTHGAHRVAPVWCSCRKKIHRSGIRAQAFARRVAQEAGSNARQHDYRCVWNPRIFHLSSKRNGKPIPGAYVVLVKGWNDQ